jgi:hypothetical protein
MGVAHQAAASTIAPSADHAGLHGGTGWLTASERLHFARGPSGERAVTSARRTRGTGLSKLTSSANAPGKRTIEHSSRVLDPRGGRAAGTRLTTGSGIQRPYLSGSSRRADGGPRSRAGAPGSSSVPSGTFRQRSFDSAGARHRQRASAATDQDQRSSKRG